MTTGLFGKLPAHGDFVRRGLPRSFVSPWDAWLSEGIHAARATLGEDWDAAWEAAPIWRFRLSPGACGPDAVVGVVATSHDMVGRQFPLTLAAILPGAAIPPPDDWYAALEDALPAARAGGLDADALAALLPPAPADDSDATLDGRSVFWSAGLPARSMPGALEFIRLLERPAGRVPLDAGRDPALVAADTAGPDDGGHAATAAAPPASEATGPEANRPCATGPEANGPQANGPQATGPEANRPCAIGPEEIGPQATGSEAAATPLDDAPTLPPGRLTHTVAGSAPP